MRSVVVGGEVRRGQYVRFCEICRCERIHLKGGQCLVCSVTAEKKP